MARNILWFLFLAPFLGGCSVEPFPWNMGNDHPASPGAAEAPFHPPAPLLASPLAKIETPVVQQAGLPALPDEASQHLADLITAYLAAGDRLADDTTDGLTADTRQAATAVRALAEVELPDQPHFWHQHSDELQIIRDEVETLAAGMELAPARLAYGRWSDAMERLIRAAGLPTGEVGTIGGFICGMAKDVPRKGVWLQLPGKPRNPYFGSRMLRCASEEFSLPVAGGTPDHKQDIGQEKTP